MPISARSVSIRSCVWLIWSSSCWISLFSESILAWLASIWFWSCVCSFAFWFIASASCWMVARPFATALPSCCRAFSISCCAPASGVGDGVGARVATGRSEEHTSELQSRRDLVCRLLLEKKKKNNNHFTTLKKKKKNKKKI